MGLSVIPLLFLISYSCLASIYHSDNDPGPGPDIEVARPVSQSRRLQPGNALNTAQLTNPYVDGTGTLKLPVYLTSVALSGDNGDNFSISFPGTWFNLPSTLNINVKNFADGSTAVRGLAVTVYPSAQQIKAFLPAKTTLNLNIDYYLEINGFLNPPYLDSCTSGTGCTITYGAVVNLATTDSFTIGATNGFWQDLRIQAGQVSSFSFSSQSAKANAINLTFVISFSTGPRVPLGSTITATLPSTYPQLALRSPAASCTTALTGGSCVISGNSAVLTGFSALPANTLVSITIRQAKNPAKVGSFSGFSISASNSSSKTVISQIQTTSVAISQGDTAALFEFTLVASTPTSGISTSYVLNASTGAVLYSGSTITLAFPLSFPLPTSVGCLNLSGIKAYKSCGVGTNNNIQVILNGDVSANTLLSITFSGVLNPPVTVPNASGEQLFGPVTLVGTYDGVTLAASDPKTSVSLLPIAVAAKALPINSVSLIPLNEGELGTYIIKFPAPAGLTGNANIGVSIVFPTQYSASLVPAGTSLFCSSTPAFKSCGFNSPYTVTYYNLLTSVQQNSVLSFSLYGVTNPVSGLTNFINIEVVDLNTLAILYWNSTAAQFTISAPSGAMDIISMSTSSIQTGSISIYTFSLDTQQTLFAANGAIWITWPRNYLNDFYANDLSLSCLATYATVSTACQWQDETFRMRTQVLVPLSNAANQFDSGVSQIVTVTLYGVPNPRSPGKTLPFVFGYINLDTLTMLTSTRGVKNQPDTLIFQAAPYSITPSTTSISLVMGTYSDEVTLTLGVPAYDPLQISLYSDNGQVVFDPEVLINRYAWDNVGTFRVGVTNSSLAGTYTIGLSKDEGSTWDRFQPIDVLTLYITEPHGTLPVSIDLIPALELYATSLPVAVTLSKPTLYPLYVNLTTISPDQSDNIIFTPSFLLFNPGDWVQTFTVTTTTDSVSGKIQAQLGGAGSPAYVNILTTPLQIIPHAVISPEVLFYNVTAVGRTSATVEIWLSKMGTVYYACTWSGSDTPSVATLVAQVLLPDTDAPQIIGFAYTTVVPKTSLSLQSDYYIATIDLEGLQEAADYVLFFTKVGTYMELDETDPFAYEFYTLPAYPPVTFTVLTANVDNAADVRSAVASALGVPKTLIQYTGVNYNTTSEGHDDGNRRLQPTSVGYPYPFLMVMDNMQEIGSPYSHVIQLQNRKDIILASLPDLWSAQNITSTVNVIGGNAPEFIYNPIISAVTNFSVSIDVIQTTAGHIYGVLIDLHAPRPSVLQIVNGLDASNHNVPSGRFQFAACVSQRSVTLKFTNIQYFTRYQIWLAGSNDFADFPSYTHEEDVRSINATVGKLDSAVAERVIELKLSDEGTWLSLAIALIFTLVV